MNVENYGNVTVVKLSGALDAAISEEISTELIAHIQDGSIYLVIDMGSVDYMSSAALRALLATCQEARRFEGDLRIAKAEGSVLKVMEIAGFTRIMTFFERLPTAIRSYT